MDEMSGQFYAIYGNTYECMSTKPMLEQAWGTGELIDQLIAMRQAFGYVGLSGPMPLFNQSPPAASTTSHKQDDILSKKPAPKTIQYQPPSFNLGRPTTCLTMEERIQVHHNYISALSNLKHKKDLINRLKRSDPHNISAYEAGMTHHMMLHEDVLGRILTILKQDEYYRTLEELPPTKTSSSSPNYMTLSPSLNESPVKQISSKDNLDNQVCTHYLELLCLLLQVLCQNPPQHFNLLHQLHHRKQLTHTKQTDNKVLRHHQKVHYLVDNRLR